LAKVLSFPPCALLIRPLVAATSQAKRSASPSSAVDRIASPLQLPVMTDRRDPRPVHEKARQEPWRASVQFLAPRN
jgi:hypothetical protein